MEGIDIIRLKHWDKAKMQCGQFCHLKDLLLLSVSWCLFIHRSPGIYYDSNVQFTLFWVLWWQRGAKYSKALTL